jgi:protein SCO1/2
LVTGKKRRIDRLLKALGAFNAAKEEHPPILVIGNDAASVWTRASGLTPPEKLVELFDHLLNGVRAKSEIRREANQ